MSNQFTDEHWMAQALQLARRGLYSTAPNPRVGCVFVKQNELVTSGWHEYSGGPHAEINAINTAQIETGCDIYITLEPCSHQGKTPPCIDALIALQPERVIVAMQDTNSLVAGEGIEKLHLANINVVCGVLETQARELNCGFVSRFERQRPFVRLKMATSLDGKTALNNGDSQWITGEAARHDVQFLRARSSAILTTAATVLSDDPSLNLRLSAADLEQNIAVRQPVRVVVDSSLRLSGKEKIFKQGGSVWIYTLCDDPSKHQALELAGADITLLDKGGSKQIDLEQMMQHLASREINEVHTECGQSLAGALLQEKLVDELVIYIAPVLLGSRARGAFDLGELTQMKSRIGCKINQIRNIGDDLRITLTPEQN
ncbi:MAG: bifunctional diaminohydroxyphosphoribosylaminopyrimidine deaminase/5-amino-6-(5-phosphoribosylamino)uracil reductase RibD [Gammaproteobacteria bacterium]|nr:bifunctional diaminohydroxyphosphoribosylaminopyrimidine deaminase/5-amino-6-(5-phosphoribosylamino)uracil reductase RibD [Gammaproteobacteria bacterium]